MTMLSICAAVLVLGAPPAGAPGMAPASLAGQIEARLRAGDPDGAVREAELATREFPEDPRLWIALGHACGARAQTASLFARLGFARKCRAAFAAALRLDPESVEARMALFQYDLRAPGLAGGSHKRARREAEEILSRDPARGHAARGALAAAEGRLEEAETQLREALALSPESAETRAELARVLLESGRYEEAKALLRREAGNGGIEDFLMGRACRLSGTDLAEGAARLRAYLAAEPAPGDPRPAEARRELVLLDKELERRPDAGEPLRSAPTEREARRERPRNER